MDVSLLESVIAASYVNIVVTRGSIFSWLRRGRFTSKLFRCIMCFSIYASTLLLALHSARDAYYGLIAQMAIRILAISACVYFLSLLYDLIETATADVGQHTALNEINTKLAEGDLIDRGAAAMRAYENIE